MLHGLEIGGAEVLAARLARRLRDKFHFVFACLDELGTLGKELRSEGFAVEVLGRRRGLDWRCSRRLAKFMRRHRVKLLHAHQYTPFFYGLTARLFHRLPSILFLEHGRHFPDYRRVKRVIANRLFLAKRDRVVGVGEAVRRALVDNEGIAPERVGVIYNGIDVRTFAGVHRFRKEVRNELRVDESDFVLLQVARLDYLKNHATALRTLERVRAVVPRTVLVLAGDGPELPKIQALVNDKQLENHVRFLGMRKDVARLLGGADCFLLTSISEGIPITLIEAMSAGLPVVATDVGGVGEVVENGKSGLLASAQDDAFLAEQVLRLHKSARLRQQIIQSGLERAQALFSETKMHAAYLRLYKEMLSD